MTTNPLGGRNSAGSVADDVHARRVEPGLLDRLAQRRGDHVLVLRGRPPRRGRPPARRGCACRGRARSAARRRRPSPGRRLAEQHEHRRLAAALVRRQEPAQLLGPHVQRGLRERPQPLRQPSYAGSPAARSAPSQPDTEVALDQPRRSSACDWIAPIVRPATLPSAVDEEGLRRRRRRAAPRPTRSPSSSCTDGNGTPKSAADCSPYFSRRLVVDAEEPHPVAGRGASAAASTGISSVQVGHQAAHTLSTVGVPRRSARSHRRAAAQAGQGRSGRPPCDAASPRAAAGTAAARTTRSRRRAAAARPASTRLGRVAGRSRRSQPSSTSSAASDGGPRSAAARGHADVATWAGVLTSFAALTGSISPSPYDGQSRATGQAPQAGLRAWQHAAAVEDQPVAEHRPVPLREQRADLVLDLDRVVLGGPAEAAGQPAEVGVDGDAGDAEGVAQHHVGGLAADAGQRDQVAAAAAAPPRRTARRGPGRARSASWSWPGRSRSSWIIVLQLGAVGGGVVGGASGSSRTAPA